MPTANKGQSDIVTPRLIPTMSDRLFTTHLVYLQNFYGVLNGKEATVNRALDGSTYPS
jgi:hypothetical protein